MKFQGKLVPIIPEGMPRLARQPLPQGRYSARSVSHEGGDTGSEFVCRAISKSLQYLMTLVFAIGCHWRFANAPETKARARCPWHPQIQRS